MYRFFRNEPLTGREQAKLLAAGAPFGSVVAESWFLVETNGLLRPGEVAKFSDLLDAELDHSSPWPHNAVEVGPRLTFESPLSSTLRGVSASIGIGSVWRLEHFRRYTFPLWLDPESRHTLAAVLHDPMTQALYDQPLRTFRVEAAPAQVRVIPLIEEGMAALEEANKKLAGGLGMTKTTMRWMYDLFVHQLRRNPTDVEVASLALANSEHSRHQTMRGEVVLDGNPLGHSLFDVFMMPYRANPNNSVIAFHDNASAITGPAVLTQVVNPDTREYESRLVRMHPTNTAETHSGPSEVAPYPGAGTGPGGELRDALAPGRGGLPTAGGLGICVANLAIPGYEQPWEVGSSLPRDGLPSALQVLTEGTDGAADYNNCFGRPVITGHAASFEMVLKGVHYGWRKPILYTQGVGVVREEHAQKTPPQPDMLVVQLGGPAYPIGIGGGTFSSKTPGSKVSEADLAAVQRPDPAVERSLYCVIRACVELGPDNPIESAHDLGAGGDANALPEIVGESGGRFNVEWLPVGDTGMSVLEIFICEAQERVVVLVRPDNWPRLQQIAEREGTIAAVVGRVTGDGNVVLEDSAVTHGSSSQRTPVDLPAAAFSGSGVIEPVRFERVERQLEPLALPDGLTVREALERVFRLMTVASKHHIIDKVDRSVGGLVAQQQCVGPFHTPLCGYGLVAHSMEGVTGTATAHGERHRFGFISPVAQARMSVVEVLQKLMGVVITGLPDIKFSGNWMWPPVAENGQGADMYQAAVALARICIALGIAEDGGKDSIFMRSFDNQGNLVVSPEQLMLAPYVTVSDVRLKVTPELKRPGNSLVLIDLSGGQARLGGSVLAQVYGQVGDDCPDLTDFDLLKCAFAAVQGLVADGQIVSLHGRSDGGLVTTLIEMSIAGGLGIDASVIDRHSPIASLLNEEAGVVVECADYESVRAVLVRNNIPCRFLGTVGAPEDGIEIRHNGMRVVSASQVELRALWYETSLEIDATQSNPACIAAERAVLQRELAKPDWRLTFVPQRSLGHVGPKVAVLRGPATNGECEMAESARAAGFGAFDVHVSDLVNGDVSLEEFQGLLLPGGFSYGDLPVAGAALTAVIRYNSRVASEMEQFRARPDTFAFGVCNGAQLMLRLGWCDAGDGTKLRFATNAVERHKSTMATVEIGESSSLLFQGMAGSRLGVWVSHGQGRLVATGNTLDMLAANRQVPMAYVTPDGLGVGADTYPYNPSGTPRGWPGVCSGDGRFTAIMPHPERMANQLWQWPYLPTGWEKLATSPWLRPFQNARDWCESHA